MNDNIEPARNGQTRILVIDDHAVIREGLTLLINKKTDLVVSAQAETVLSQAIGIMLNQQCRA